MLKKFLFLSLISFTVCNTSRDDDDSDDDSNQNITKKQVAVACKTSEVTISKCFKKLNEKRFELLPRDVVKEYNVT